MSEYSSHGIKPPSMRPTFAIVFKCGKVPGIFKFRLNFCYKTVFVPEIEAVSDTKPAAAKTAIAPRDRWSSTPPTHRPRTPPSTTASRCPENPRQPKMGTRRRYVSTQSSSTPAKELFLCLSLISLVQNKPSNPQMNFTSRPHKLTFPHSWLPTASHQTTMLAQDEIGQWIIASLQQAPPPITQPKDRDDAPTRSSFQERVCLIRYGAQQLYFQTLLPDFHKNSNKKQVLHFKEKANIYIYKYIFEMKGSSCTKAARRNNNSFNDPLMKIMFRLA